jgi:hypothetical protein
MALAGMLLASMPTHAAAPALEVHDPPPQTEVIPVPRIPADPSRSGRGLLAVGGVLLGLGAAGRFAIEGFWAGPAQLEAREPFGQWSIPTIAFFTSFSNVLVVPGLVLTGFGARRHGTWRVASGARPDDPALTRRNRRLGWGLFGGGLSLWAVTRAAAIPVLRGCETNGCAYGYLESTFWLSLGTAVSGVALVGLAAGERRFARHISVVPTFGPSGPGFSLGGWF